jgi:hypothetical protein
VGLNGILTADVVAVSCRDCEVLHTFPPVRGALTFHDPDGPVTLAGRVVQYGNDGGSRFSWHGDLSRRVGQHALLVTDSGDTFEVVVANGFLRLAPPQPLALA